jgi:hypothetical protein
MHDREMVAATLAAALLRPLDWSKTSGQDPKIVLGRVASLVVNTYDAILAELAKREASNSGAAERRAA